MVVIALIKLQLPDIKSTLHQRKDFFIDISQGLPILKNLFYS